MFMPYREDQWEKYHQINKVPKATDEGKDLKRHQPIFTGQRCYAGIDTLTIDSDGNVWRGWCQQGGIIGNIYKEPVNWPKDPIVCQKDFCHNGFDQQAKKEKI